LKKVKNKRAIIKYNKEMKKKNKGLVNKKEYKGGLVNKIEYMSLKNMKLYEFRTLVHLLKEIAHSQLNWRKS
jgi:hypothetical protein